MQESSRGKALEPVQVAQRLNRDVETVRRWIRTGKLLAFNLGTADRPSWIVYEEDLEEFLGTRSNQ